MFRNYLTVALRQISKNKIYALINILGLVVGLTVFLFGNLLIDYEKSHDKGFEKSERIYSMSSVFADSVNMGIRENDSIYTAFAPLLQSEVPDLEAVTRIVKQEYLLSIGDSHFYHNVRFVDDDFLQIFDLDYIEGDKTALDDPSGLLITRSIAEKLFGHSDVLGETVLLDHSDALRVTTVVEDLPANTHFNSSIMGMTQFEMLAPLKALNRISGYDLSGNWNNLSNGDTTFVLLPEGKSIQWLQSEVDRVYEQHVPPTTREFVQSYTVRPLIKMNTQFWDAVGMPVLESVQLLALLVLIVAIVNYTNLATAQSLGRAREVGLRKTMGASRTQLLTQFLVESVCITLIAMLIALVVLEVTVPVFNGSTGRALELNYLTLLPWLLATSLAVGLIAGAYPAYLITRSTPIDALRENKVQKPGGLFRSAMLGLQFAISIFMLSMVLVVYLQNERNEDAGNIYPKEHIIGLQRLQVPDIQTRLDTLRSQLVRHPDIESVTYSSHIPFQFSNSSRSVTPEKGNEVLKISTNQISIDEFFSPSYDIPILAGRNFSLSMSQDYFQTESEVVNVIVNELLLDQLGFPAREEAIGKLFHNYSESGGTLAFKVIGVFPDQNIQGFHNEIKPTFFYMKEHNASNGRGGKLRNGSIRVKTTNSPELVTFIEDTWREVMPDYPLKMEFLTQTFDKVAKVYAIFTKVLGGFALIAFVLSLVGLFGLAAFMAESRTREIGIRKVMGADISQLVRLMVWQFSKPVIWALFVALPAAYFASNMYLNFFSNRLPQVIFVILFAGIVAIVFSWLIVAIHAYKVARATPIRALRYE